MTDRTTLLTHLDALLQPERFKDYGPNGLQVEGRMPVRRLVTGVTASLALIEAAIAANADAILVHHGLFWRGQDGRVTGWMRQRLGQLLAHDINLFAYHLPLDAHPFANAQALANHVQTALGRTVVLVPGSGAPLSKIAWCTGGAQSYFEAAIAAGADAFITGEISEPQAHYARECGVAYVACGHHASERYGVQAVGAHVSAILGLDHQFIDIDNPA
jgi:putative NIF3 family GTP cyclohydrolase 1 type 2